MGTKLDFKVKKGLDVEGGDITVATGNSVYADTFDTNVTAAGVTLSGTTLAADGSDTNINIAITPKGSGEVDISKVDIDGGAIDGTIIGANTAAAGTFTSGTFSSLNVSDGNITNVGNISTDIISVDDVAVGLDIQFGGNTTLNKISLTDNLADALNITQGANSYMKFVTTNDSEVIELGKDLSLSDNNITNVGDINADSISVDAASTGLNVDFSGGNDTTGLITLKDNVAQALRIVNGDPLAVGTKTFIEFDTTDDSEETEFKVPISVLGSAANQDVAVIKTTNANSTSGNLLNVQWHNGSAYASALQVTALRGRVGIAGGTPDTADTAAANKLVVGGNTKISGTLDATGNLTVTGTGTTGGDFTATNNNKPVKLRMSDGFPTGTASGTHPITDYNGENFYSSMSKESTITNGASIAPGTIRSIGYVNMAGSKDKFQVVEVFATISIKNSSSNEITKRLTEKIYGIYDNGDVETVREWSQGDTSLGQFHCIYEDAADVSSGSGNAAIEVAFRYTHHTNVDSSNNEDEKISVNINGLSIHGTPPS